MSTFKQDLLRKGVGLGLAAAMIVPGVSMAGFSGNIGFTSNYIWRGLTQTDDQAAISGGLDYEVGNGLYLGTWVSNVNFGDDWTGDGEYELDLYGGYGGEINDFSYDVGFISYQYPLSDFDFNEIYAGIGYSLLSAKFSYSNDFNDAGDSAWYLEAGADFTVGEDLGIGLHIGKSDGDAFDVGGASFDYVDYGVTLSKGDFAFMVSNTDIDDDDPRVAVSWGKSFDL